MEFTISYIRSVVQVALLGAVTSNLRAVIVTVLSQELKLYFYYESEPTEEEVELSRVTSTEVFSDFINVSVEEQQIVLPKSEPIPFKNGDLWVYYRYEGNLINKIKQTFNEITVSSISSASQIALLGAVTSNLRAVLVAFTENDLTLNFYYDKEPSNKEIELSENVLQEVVSSFEKAIGKVERFVIPEPEKDSFRDQGMSVYWRYEEYLEDD